MKIKYVRIILFDWKQAHSHTSYTFVRRVIVVHFMHWHYWFYRHCLFRLIFFVCHFSVAPHNFIGCHHHCVAITSFTLQSTSIDRCTDSRIFQLNACGAPVLCSQCTRMRNNEKLSTPKHNYHFCEYVGRTHKYAASINEQYTNYCWCI